jgi:hypothetical protein
MAAPTVAIEPLGVDPIKVAHRTPDLANDRLKSADCAIEQAQKADAFRSFLR